MPVQVVHQASGQTVFSGLTDLNGEADLPKLQSGDTYTVLCATTQNSALAACGTFTAGTEATVRQMSAALTTARNLRLYGHVGTADGGTCGLETNISDCRGAATVQLLDAAGQALTPPLRVNRFGDYALDASVPVQASLKLVVQCEAYSRTLDVPVSPDPAGYVSTVPIELSHQVANSRPQIVKMVANGLDGNVRGRMVFVEQNVLSNGLPGSQQFLTFKGRDTRQSACVYYRALGMVKDCDAQGKHDRTARLRRRPRPHRRTRLLPRPDSPRLRPRGRLARRQGDRLRDPLDHPRRRPREL